MLLTKQCRGFFSQQIIKLNQYHELEVDNQKTPQQPKVMETLLSSINKR